MQKAGGTVCLTVCACLALALAPAAPTRAQAGPGRAPQPIPPRGAVEGRLAAEAPRGVDGAPFDCFAVETDPGSRWTIRARSSEFSPELWVARGALCTVSSPAYRQVADLSGVAELSFDSPGGRYLVLVRSQGGTGAYSLDAMAGPSGGAGAGGGAGERARSGSGLQTASAPEDARVAIMRRQAAELESRRQAEAEAARMRAEQQRIAQEQAAAQRRAAERRQRQENDAFWGAVLSGTVQAMNEVTAEMAAENARMAEAQAQRLAQQQQEIRQRNEQVRLANAEAAQRASTSRPASGGATTQAQDRDQAEAHARQRSQAEQARRQQESQLIREAEARRIAAEQRAAEARSQAWLRSGGLGAASSAGSSGPASTAASGGASQVRAMAASPSGGYARTGLQPVPRGTAGPSHHGSLSRQVGAIGQCRASQARLNYDLHTLLGEPLASAEWEFSGADGCTAPANVTIWVRLEAGAAYGYVKISTTAPSANQGEGTSMGSTGMDWSAAACGFAGSRTAGCLSEQDAKSLWVNGRVTGFEIGW